MITDEGFKYLIKAPGAATKIAKLVLGTDKESIVDLDPPTSINQLQSIVTGSPLTFKGTTNTFKVLDFSKGIIYHYAMTDYNGEIKSKYYEYGYFGDNDNLLYYKLNTNTAKTFISKIYNYADVGYFKSSIKLSNPLKNISKNISMLSEGVLKDYIVNYNSVAYLTTPSLITDFNITCEFKNSTGTLISYGESILESYDLATREALFNLKVVLDRSQISANNYILFTSLFCNLKIFMTDPSTLEPVNWPLTDGEALIIPLKVYLGEPK